jgi:hypothetical protein
MLVHFDASGPAPADGGPRLGTTVPSTVGPLSVPSDGAPLRIAVRPVQAVAFEVRAAGDVPQLEWVTAHVYDPTSGQELKGAATVAVAAAGATTPMPWGVDTTGDPAYFGAISPSVDAPATFTVTASHPSFGTTPGSVPLAGHPPDFDGAVTAPADGASVPAGQALTVQWAPEPQADFELAELFASRAGGLAATFVSPIPDAPDLLQEVIPASSIASPGTYQVDVTYSKTYCPATTGGCVHAGTTAIATITAR